MKRPQGRFGRPINPEALAFSSSLPVDSRLWSEDIRGSLAHVAMLAQQGIIARADARKIVSGLKRILREIASGHFDPSASSHGRWAAEDIHMAVEQRLTALIGPAGGKLHTARSRNDQVALDERLYLRTAIAAILSGIRSTQNAILKSAEHHSDVLMPGMTHLQPAQPVLLAHHLLAWIDMLQRDADRFTDCRRRTDNSPLGAGAFAGVPYPIDRSMTAHSLGFDGVIGNSIDAVSDRDVLIECVSACALTMMHLSRFAEEIVIWNSHEWGFITIGDGFTTGSSMMPQKKNPDIAELVRGKTGRVYGDLVALLTLMKGLPLAYNRDMQEDKEPLFDAVDTLTASLSVFTGMMRTVKFAGDLFETRRHLDFLFATDLADYCVRKGLAFRDAHRIVGEIVRQCVRDHIGLRDVTLERYKSYSPVFAADVYKLFDPRRSVSAKRSAGSTSPSEVAKALRAWTRKLASDRTSPRRHR